MNNNGGCVPSQGGSCSQPLPIVACDKHACLVSTDFQEIPETQTFLQNLLICKCWQLIQFFFSRHLQAQTKHVCKPDVDQSLRVCSGCPDFRKQSLFGVVSQGYWQLLYFSLKHKNLTLFAKRGKLGLRRQKLGCTSSNEARRKSQLSQFEVFMCNPQ